MGKKKLKAKKTVLDEIMYQMEQLERSAKRTVKQVTKDEEKMLNMMRRDIANDNLPVGSPKRKKQEQALKDAERFRDEQIELARTKNDSKKRELRKQQKKAEADFKNTGKR